MGIRQFGLQKEAVAHPNATRPGKHRLLDRDPHCQRATSGDNALSA